MKQKNHFCVYNSVLTYFKDVFDGTSPYWRRSRFLLPCFYLNTKQFDI